MASSVLPLLVMVGLASGLTRTIDNTCPPDLVKEENDHYLQVHDGVCYRFVVYRTKVYADAAMECRRHGGSLAMPKTKSANDKITSLLIDTYRSEGDAWIGLNDLKREGWIEFEDGTTPTWTNFAEDNGYHNGVFVEDCVAINVRDRRWHDYQCESNMVTLLSLSRPFKRFICQYTIYTDEIQRTQGKGDTAAADDDISNKKDLPGKKTDNGDSGGVSVGSGRENSAGDNEGQGPVTPADTDRVKQNRKKGDCGSFACDKDCGFFGFQRNEHGCQICECN